jgi:hypothetical protein
MPLDLILQDENDDPWHPEPTESQILLDTVITQGIEFVIETANGCPVYVHHLGDVTHGAKHSDSELVSTRMSDHLEIAAANMSRWLKYKNVKYLGMYKGTGSHEYGQGSSTIVVAKWLGELYEDKSILCVAHANVLHQGVRFDLAHHGPGPGIRNWLKGNVLRLYTRSLMMDYLAQDKPVPDVMARAHFHRYVPETVKIRSDGITHKTRAFILPSFSFLSDYARKVAKSPATLTVGMVVIEVVDGEIIKVYDESPLIETFDLRKEIVIDDIK